ncbi:uncharacterized protein SAPINGB_P000619 [Magnusiomyces paraingens]|uniref:BolA protein n=1 Tax=Magnusiomyces paraingens TaxID=2606893 RepID=A0A5E8B2B4_9ASCO|nr:uncharacterized protein SAPINGB_P000619 [Saprochaete ingens]VVT45045.1 unnamed protein product [Saprochaete ingens]
MNFLKQSSTQISRLTRSSPTRLSYYSINPIFSRMSSSSSASSTATSTTTSESSAPLTTPIGDTDGGPITTTIIQRVQENFAPSYFAIYNDSRFHAHHAARRNSENKVESHFRLEIVSNAFKGKPQPARHRQVYNLFKEEMAMPNGVHSMSLKTKTEDEWAKLQQNEKN